MMVKLVIKLISCVVFSALSPTWILMDFALAGYFDIKKAVLGPIQLIEQMDHFTYMVMLNPDAAMQLLIPKMLLVMILSIVFAVGMMHLCSRFANAIVNRLSGLQLLPQ